MHPKQYFKNESMDVHVNEQMFSVTKENDSYFIFNN